MQNAKKSWQILAERSLGFPYNTRVFCFSLVSCAKNFGVKKLSRMYIFILTIPFHARNIYTLNNEYKYMHAQGSFGAQIFGKILANHKKVENMRNKCRVVGHDRVFNSTQELALAYDLRHSSVINAIRHGYAHQGYRFELVDLPKRYRWFGE